MKSSLSPLLLRSATLVLFVIMLAAFGAMEPRFLAPQNLINIVVQSASTAIVAAGMTFVLLTAGVDLSVGAIMFVGAAVAGKMAVGGAPLGACVAALLGIGLLGGIVNALLVTRLRIVAFIATLGTLYIGRGFATWLTQTRAINLPDASFPALASGTWLGVPLPLWLLGLVLVIAHVVLTRTAFGRQVYAVGHNAEAARKAGVNTTRILAGAYLISGGCAALGGVITLGQLGSVSPKFGEFREFAAIAAAVLGGTSLFGGRGNVLPGTLLGAVFIQSVENGLVVVNADPYLYPMITSAVIFLAVLLDSLSHLARQKATRRFVIAGDGG